MNAWRIAAIAAGFAGLAPFASAQTHRVNRSEDPGLDPPEERGTFAYDPRFFFGMRLGVGIPAGGLGAAPTYGIELGIAQDHGLGLGIHLIGMQNPPAVGAPINVPKADYALGAVMDMRFYIQTVKPLTLYPTLSTGFLAGPSHDTGRNVVLPMLTPGFGARVGLGEGYIAFEFGLAGFFIPFINISGGWEMSHGQR